MSWLASDVLSRRERTSVITSNLIQSASTAVTDTLSTRSKVGISCIFPCEIRFTTHFDSFDGIMHFDLLQSFLQLFCAHDFGRVAGVQLKYKFETCNIHSTISILQREQILNLAS